jgi:hypothetical protein
VGLGGRVTSFYFVLGTFTRGIQVCSGDTVVVVAVWENTVVDLKGGLIGVGQLF